MMIGAKTMNRSWCGRPLAICAVGIAVAVVTLAASVSAADFSASDALMLRLMSAHNVPGSALALIKDGSIVLGKGYGFRDLAAHAPVTTATLFNIGSISKSFTALGVAQLVDQHQVDLDAPVIRYIPDLRLSDPQATQAHFVCTDQQLGEVSPPHRHLFEANVFRPPKLQQRLSDATAMATSVVCRPSVRERNASPITRL